MSLSYARASRLASSSPKDFDFQFFVFQNEGNYPMWMSPKRLAGILYSLPESLVWNTVLVVMWMACIISHSLQAKTKEELFNISLVVVVDIVFNLVYLLDLIARILFDKYKANQMERRVTHWINIVWYIGDILSFSHFVTAHHSPPRVQFYVKLCCYYERMFRPVIFLWTLLDYFLISNVIVAFCSQCYFLYLMTVVYANASLMFKHNMTRGLNYSGVPYVFQDNFIGQQFFRKIYKMNKLFAALGHTDIIYTDHKRISRVVIMLVGCLVIRMIAVASLALVIGIYLRPEEAFRSRFRLIMNDMQMANRTYQFYYITQVETQVPKILREKVDTFYRMYWLKQKAVSVTRLLPTYPSTLISAINSDIYFEAQQKSRVLRDLSFQFFSEIAKLMQTIHYIPGDIIVSRNSLKNTIIYISYGDVEMLTAEDDDTPVLRFTRGTIINQCGPCVQVAASRAHNAIRAATFCTAHVLKTVDLWRVTMKYGKINGQSFILRSSFEEHFERVKHHFAKRDSPDFKYNSNIIVLKRNLIELKQSIDPDTGRPMLSRTDIFIQIAGCYIMRNRNDAKLTEESDAICLHPTFPCILQPLSTLIIAWETFIALIALCIAFMYPFYMVFIGKLPITFRFYDYMLTSVFIVDIIAHLSTGVQIEEGVPITFRHTSARQLKSIWLALDILSAAPIFEFIGDGYFAGLNKIFKLFKVFRVLKHYENKFIYQAKLLRFFSYFILILLLVYLLGAIHQGHLCFEHGYCDVLNITKPPFWAKIKAKSNVKLRISFNMLWSISVLTFCSHPTAAITTNNWKLALFTLLFVDVCMKINIMLRAAYSATIMVGETMSVNYDTCIQTVKEFMIKHQVDPVLRHRFITYLELCWFTDKAYAINHGKDSILFDLPPHVFQDIMALQRNKFLLCIPFMKFVNKEMLKNISSKARLFYSSPNEILLNTGDIGNEIYVIKQGFCEVVDPDSKKVVSLVTANSFFGSMECLLRIPAFYTVRAVTHVQVLSIARKHLMRAIYVPKIRDAILHSKQQPEYSRLMKRREQFMTYEMPPAAANREFFPLPRKHEPDTAFLFPFNRLGFLALLRYVFPRYTIRPDGKYIMRYEWFRAACAVLSSNFFPLYSVLVLEWQWLFYFCWFLDISAYFDIIQRMLVGYFDKNGILVYHPASTAAHYMKGAFFVDFLACAPLETLDDIREFIFPKKQWFLYPVALQYFMYNRLLQIYRYPNALDQVLNSYIERKDIVFIIKSFPMFMVVLILLTSLVLETTVYKYTSPTAPYYIEIKYDKKFGTWINNDLLRYNSTGSAWNLVLTTYFWVTSELTSTGFSLYYCSKNMVIYYFIIGSLVGLMVTTYFAVRVISIRANVNQALAGYRENIRDIKEFMKKEKLDKELQREVMCYYEYTWEKTGGTNYRSVLKMCDQITLRTDTILHIYGPTFSKCPIMYRCEQSLLRVVGRAVYSIYYQENMMLVDRDEVLSDMYFIDNGTLEVRGPDDVDVLTVLPRGSVFGNLNNTSSTISANRYVAVTNLHLLRINTKVFYKIIQDFPTARLLMMKHRPHDESFIIGGMQGKVTSVFKERAQSSPKVTLSHKGFLHFVHSHKFQYQIYMIVVSLICVYADIYNAGFLNNSTEFVSCLYILDLLFYIKILLNYAMPYITDSESESKVVLLSSWKHYFKTEFKFDVMSCIPFEIFCFTSPYKWTAFAFLRLNRLFRLVTVHHCLKRIHTRLSTNLTVSMTTTLLIWFTFYVHVATCSWFLIGRLEELMNYESSWIYENDEKHICQNHYVCSFYFVICMFTSNGISDILPKHQIEVVFVCAMMIISNLLFMIYVGEFTNIVGYRAFRSFSFYSKYLQLQDFLKNNRVSKNLVELTKTYTLHLWRESRGLQAPHFLLAAPQCLKQRIMSAAYMHHLLAHPDFKDCEPAFLRHLAGCFKQYYYKEGMFVVREGEITNSMYFIHKGKVQEIAEDIEEKMHIFNAVEHFGTLQGLHRNMPFHISYKTVIKSEILILSLRDWEQFLQHFPKSKENIYMVKPDVYKAQPPKTSHTDKKSVKLSKVAKYRMFKSITSSAVPKSAKLEKAAAKLNAKRGGATANANARFQKTSRSPPVGPDIAAGTPETPEVMPPLSPAVTTGTATPFSGIPSGRHSDDFHSLPIGQTMPTAAPSPDVASSPNAAPEGLVPEPTGSIAKSAEEPAKEPSKVESDEEEYVPPPPAYGRRKSTILGVDKAAVEEELKKLSSDVIVGSQFAEPEPALPEPDVALPFIEPAPLVPEESLTKPDIATTEPISPTSSSTTKTKPETATETADLLAPPSTTMEYLAQLPENKGKSSIEEMPLSIMSHTKKTLKTKSNVEPPAEERSILNPPEGSVTSFKSIAFSKPETKFLDEKADSGTKTLVPDDQNAAESNLKSASGAQKLTKTTSKFGQKLTNRPLDVAMAAESESDENFEMKAKHLAGSSRYKTALVLGDKSESSHKSNLSKQLSASDEPTKPIDTSDEQVNTEKEKGTLLGFKDTVTTYKDPKNESNNDEEMRTKENEEEGEGTSSPSDTKTKQGRVRMSFAKH